MVCALVTYKVITRWNYFILMKCIFDTYSRHDGIVHYPYTILMESICEGSKFRVQLIVQMTELWPEDQGHGDEKKDCMQMNLKSLEH